MPVSPRKATKSSKGYGS